VLRDQELHVLLFNCVRELLSNVVRHAGAAHATVRLQKPPGELRIQVCDDGRGFSPMPASQGEVPAAPPQDDLPESSGLTTIRHKLSLYGGSMQITSAPGQGTQVLLVVPLAGEGTRPSPS
jgi:signal transduction histidine kinase